MLEKKNITTKEEEKEKKRNITNLSFLKNQLHTYDKLLLYLYQQTIFKTLEQIRHYSRSIKSKKKLDNYTN